MCFFCIANKKVVVQCYFRLFLLLLSFLWMLFLLFAQSLLAFHSTWKHEHVTNKVLESWRRGDSRHVVPTWLCSASSFLRFSSAVNFSSRARFAAASSSICPCELLHGEKKKFNDVHKLAHQFTGQLWEMGGFSTFKESPSDCSSSLWTLVSSEF